MDMAGWFVEYTQWGNTSLKLSVRLRSAPVEQEVSIRADVLEGERYRVEIMWSDISGYLDRPSFLPARYRTDHAKAKDIDYLAYVSHPDQIDLWMSDRSDADQIYYWYRDGIGYRSSSRFSEFVPTVEWLRDSIQSSLSSADMGKWLNIYKLFGLKDVWIERLLRAHELVEEL